MHIVLDLDGTLVSEPAYWQPVENFPVAARPYLFEFLDFCFQNFETVSIWTAANREWFEGKYETFLAPILAVLQRSFHMVLTGEKCSFMPDPHAVECYAASMPVKPLRKLWARKTLPHNKDNTIVVDNNPWTFVANYGNGVEIRSYHGDPDDLMLPRLTRFLQQVQHVYQQTGTVRRMEKRNWHFHY